MNIKLNCFPQGNKIALSLSFDDGKTHDRRLVSIMNQYGIKGTFHLNSGFLGLPSYISKEEIKDLYQNHEISVHSVSHPFLNQLPDQEIVYELLEDKRCLETCVDYPVRGMSYPFGEFDQTVIDIAQNLGIEYSRTVQSTLKFKLPEDFMQWHPTVHIKSDLSELWNTCLNNPFNEMRLFYVWGHSYEFEDNQSWGLIEDFCRMCANRKDVWYATSIEIKSYMDALKRLIFTVERNRVINPSAIDVWISVEDIPLCIKAGQSVQIRKGE